MRVYILTGGSHGDLHPFLAVGRELVARGHEVRFAANPYFAREVAAAGFELFPVGAAADAEQALRNADLMHPRKGGRVVFEMIFRAIPDALAINRRELQRWQPDVVLAHHICIGTRWLCAELNLPLAIAVLAPAGWISRHDPVPFTQRRPGAGWRTLARVTDRLAFGPGLWVADRMLNRVRRRLGMRAERGAFLRELRGGDLNLALWSPLLRGPVADDPPSSRICGFPWYDQGETSPLARELDEFLAAGPPPVVFSLGTAAVFRPGDFYSIAARTCVALGRRGVLLTGRGLPAPRDLPTGVRAFDYAPFSQLLPRGAATVHHGGIGSTAQSLRAGRPLVVVPHAHDQFHNALHACRLGVAAMVARHRLTQPRLVRALRDVLDDPTKALQARRIGSALAREYGAAAAALALEELGSRRAQRPVATSP